MITNKHHYVYTICNKVTRICYIGSRSSKEHPSEDLGNRYFSSSTNKLFIEEQKKTPMLFKYLILKTFQNRQDALNYEIFLHNFFDVSKNKKFYNKSKQTSVGFSTAGCILSTDHKFKISKKLKGRKDTPSQRENRFNIPRTKQWCENISNGLIGRKQSQESINKRTTTRRENGNFIMRDETKQKISEGNKGKKMSDEAKRKISESRKGIQYSEKTIQKMKCKIISEEHKQQIKNKLTGRKQSIITKEKRSAKIKNLKWCHNPITLENHRCTMIDIEKLGYVIGKYKGEKND